MKRKILSVVSILVLVLATFGAFTTNADAAYYNNSVLVKGSANFSGYSVPVEDFYLTNADAVKLSKDLAPSSIGWILIAVGFRVNPYVGATLSISYQQASDMAGKIRDITDNGGGVWIENRKDPVWGTKVYVRSWNNADKYSLTDLSQGRYQYQNYSYELISSISSSYQY